MRSMLRPAISLFVLLSALTGVAYPLAVTVLGQALFHDAANGSIVILDGKPVGSALIGQQFSSPAYFWGRLSATGTVPYNGALSSGSNYGPLNPALVDAAKARIEALRALDPHNTAPVPIDLATASGSGLDPEISLAAAHYQAARVARARQLGIEQVEALIDQNARLPWLRTIGEPRVNVLALNLALDGMK